MPQASESGPPGPPVSPARWPSPLALPDPLLINSLVRLRPWAEADAPHLAAAWADPAVSAHTAVPPDPSEAYARRWIGGDAARRRAGLCIDLVVERNETPRVLVGEVGLVPNDSGTVEMGYWIRSSETGQGYAQAALSLLAEWVYEEICTEVFADIDPANPASAAVAERAGFVLDHDGSRLWQYRPAPR